MNSNPPKNEAATAGSTQTRSEPSGPYELLVVDARVSTAAELRRMVENPWTVTSGLSVDDAVFALKRRGTRLVLLDAEVAAKDDGACCAKLRMAAGTDEAPLVLLADASTPTRLLESCWRRGLDDCMVRPLRKSEFQQRLHVLAHGANLPATSPRRLPKTVAVVGDDARYCERLVELLQFTGFHVLQPHPGGGAGQTPWPAVDLLVVAPGTDGALSSDRMAALLRSARQHGLDAQVPLLMCMDGPGTSLAVAASTLHTAPPTPMEAVVQRVNALLQRAPVNLRAEERTPFFSTAQFREAVGGAPDGWRSGFTFDISPGGVFLKTLVPCRPGSPLELQLTLGGGAETLTLPGVVAWANPFAPRRVFSYPTGMGVQFLGAPPRRLTELLESLRTKPSEEEERFG